MEVFEETEVKWITRFLSLAKLVSTWSKDPSTQVGAVIVRPDNTVCSVGFNGFPRGIADDERLLDRETKYDIIIHAEENAILSAKEDIKGYELYVYPFSPCSRCAARIIQSGIGTVIFQTTEIPHRWESNFERAERLFFESKVGFIGVNIGEI